MTDSTVSPAPGRRIAVVDDNRDSADSLSVLLGLHGHTVRAAYDGPEAIALAEEFRPEVMLLDIGLPRIDGYETARRIRPTPWGQSLWLVALTGWGDAAARSRSQAAGFDAHFVKPVDPLLLIQWLQGLAPRVPTSAEEPS